MLNVLASILALCLDPITAIASIISGIKIRKKDNLIIACVIIGFAIDFFIASISHHSEFGGMMIERMIASGVWAFGARALFRGSNHYARANLNPWRPSPQGTNRDSIDVATALLNGDLKIKK